MESKHPATWADGLPIGEAATYLKVSIDTLRRWEAKGRIRAYRTPTNQRRFHITDLDRLLTEPTEASA